MNFCMCGLGRRLEGTSPSKVGTRHDRQLRACLFAFMILAWKALNQPNLLYWCYATVKGLWDMRNGSVNLCCWDRNTSPRLERILASKNYTGSAGGGHQHYSHRKFCELCPSEQHLSILRVWPKGHSQLEIYENAVVVETD